MPPAFSFLAVVILEIESCFLPKMACTMILLFYVAGMTGAQYNGT
jgi:hypothetical protein